LKFGDWNFLGAWDLVIVDLGAWSSALKFDMPFRTRSRRLFFVLGVLGLSIFGWVWWFGTLIPWRNAYRLVAEGVETEAIVIKSFPYKNLKTGEFRCSFTIAYNGYTAEKTSVRRTVAVGTRLPVIYLSEQPDVVTVGKRSEPGYVIAAREIGYSPILNTAVYGAMMLFALVVVLAALRGQTDPEKR
jgi:hypothetical protein